MRARLAIAVAAASIGAAPSGTPAAKRPCAKRYSVHAYLAYARRVMPVPTKGQGNALDVMERCQYRHRGAVRRWRARHELRLGEHRTASSTAYSSCDSGGITAAGTGTFFGEVAENTLPLHSRIWLDRQLFGRRLFTVLDRIGSGSSLDFFMGCDQVDAYGRRDVGYRVVRG